MEILAERVIKNTKLVACKGDITAQETDAIVNAANSHLAHGGGVAGAIVRKGGYEIQEESNKIIRERGPVPVGEAVVTGAGKLKAKYVIHTVGPRWGEGDEDNKLYRAIQSVLREAEKLKISSVAIPAVSTGIFGFPKDRGARIIVKAVVDWLNSHPDTSLREVRFCNIDSETSELFKNEVAALKE